MRDSIPNNNTGRVSTARIKAVILIPVVVVENDQVVRKSMLLACLLGVPIASGAYELANSPLDDVLLIAALVREPHRMLSGV